MWLQYILYDKGAGILNMFAIMTPKAVQTALITPLWTCKINGNPTTPIALGVYAVPATQKVCSANASSDTENVFSFEGDGVGGVDLLFDYLEYIPSTLPTTQNHKYIAISYDDENVRYQGNWTNYADSAEMTPTFPGVEVMIASNPSVEYAFNGT